ncbi:hypothetical protein [Qipengyuania sp. ASV99]|uniref:hypothetical protein n=1 Tax=Qipengyuania sp. ASV99 TaxID=3399681 RepID=UPI003A4C5D6C
MLRQPIALAACIAVLSACSSAARSNDGGQLRVATAIPAAGQTPSGGAAELRANRIARLLALAEAAHSSSEREGLIKLVNSLQASGLVPHESVQVDPASDMLAKWSRAAGIEGTPFRGRLLGPAYVRGELAPGEVWRSAQTFKSGQPSTLAVSHQGSGPVRIKVSDQSSRLVCNPQISREPACRFTPMYTQRFEIELVNEGTGRAVYFLVFD